MLRSLTLAALLLISLFWAMTALAATGRPVTAPQSTDSAVASAVTSSGVITVTTTDDEANSDGDCSLREALQAAAVDEIVDACPAGDDGDLIILPQGIYTLTLGQLEISDTVTISGNAGASILDGQGGQRVLYIDPGATVKLLDLDIRNGRPPSTYCCSIASVEYCGTNEFETTGGGIVNYGDTTIANSFIHDNSAGQEADNPYTAYLGAAGGIYNKGIMAVTGSTISNNAGCVGGGIVNEGSMTISKSEIRNNQSGFGNGGGISNSGTLLITSSTISANKAADGICFVTRFNYADCRPGGAGGGIANGGDLTVTNSTFSGNAPGNGSCYQSDERGLYCGESPAGPFYTPANAIGEGGAIASGGNLRIENSTIANNLRGKNILIKDPMLPLAASQAINVGEVISYGVAGGVYAGLGSTMLKNDILADNEGSSCGGVVHSLGNNIIQATAGCTIDGSYVPWGVDLGPLQDNGGPTLTHALNQGSPAIDAGVCTTSTGAKVKVDQRGEPRPQGDGCDIGAYESPFTSTFAITNTSLPLIWH